MPDHLFWLILISVAAGSFLLGVRVESYRWRQRCKDFLVAMDAMKAQQKTARQRWREDVEAKMRGK